MKGLIIGLGSLVTAGLGLAIRAAFLHYAKKAVKVGYRRYKENREERDSEGGVINVHSKGTDF